MPGGSRDGVRVITGARARISCHSLLVFRDSNKVLKIRQPDTRSTRMLQCTAGTIKCSQ